MIGGIAMDQFGKIFRNVSTQNEQFELCEYNPKEHSYFEIIQKGRQDGKRQVVINSEIMNEILYKIISNEGFISKIKLADSTDQDIIDNVTNLIPKLRTNPLLFIELKKELEWAYDSGSIDIVSIQVIFESKLYQITSNGLIEGKEVATFFMEIINPILTSYFNE